MKLEPLYALIFAVLMVLTIPQPDYSPATVPTVAATVEAAAEMAPAPSDCGPQPERFEVDPRIGDAIGAWPIWVALPERDGRAVIAFSRDHNHTDPALPGWWDTKVGWFVKKTYKGEVKLSGFNVADHSPIYFDIGQISHTAQPILNPEQPGGFISGLDDWAFFPSLLWVSKGGCYTLSAEWNGGLWGQTVPVGYVEGW